jgi:2-methylcitrate dehydratase PrpD
MVGLLERISLVRDPAASRDTRNMRVEIEATLDDGSKQRQVCSKPPGTWGETIDPEQHGAKLRDCLNVRLKALRVDRVLEMLDGLEDLSAKDVARLMALLA